MQRNDADMTDRHAPDGYDPDGYVRSTQLARSTRHAHRPAPGPKRLILGGGYRGMAAIAGGLLIAGTSLAANPTPQQALALKPVQSGVSYQRVDDEEVAECRVEDIDREGWSGWRVIGPDGTLLRRFADTNGDKKVDLWCYFEYGVEVYRDIDSGFTGKADQYRWLGNGGTRWGLDRDEDGQIDRWKVISPEEVSAELVASIRDRDAKRFAALLASPEELESVGLEGEKLETLSDKVSQAGRGFAAFAESVEAIGPKAEWVQFAGTMPGTVPAGTDGATKDLTVYENAVAMYQNDGQSGQLLLGTLIQVGDGWRMIELPTAARGGDPIAQSSGIFFTPSVMPNPSETSARNLGGATQELVDRLEAIDRQLASATEKRQLADLHAKRADVVEKLVESSSGSPEERRTWTRQLVDTVSMAVQSGDYPGGLERLKRVASRHAGDDEALAAYATFHAISSEYVLRQAPEDADFAEVQEWYLDRLATFVDRYPESPEAGEAMLQLALSKEFEEKEKDALAYYRKVATAFPESSAGEKAAGAVRRLESVGKTIELAGTTLDGKPLSLADLRGRPVVVHYWANWCEPCKQDMKMLRRLQSQYQRARLAIVGVNVDVSRDQAVEYVKTAQLGWPQLFAPGGLEGSPHARRFGIQTLPTMMLIDGSGKVVSHNIRAAELPDAIDQVLQGATAGNRRAAR